MDKNLHTYSKQRLLTATDGILASGLFIPVFGLYWRTVAVGLLPGDGGEFQALAYILGHTHPTGYPVYLLVARLFALLPTADLATRVSLFSGAMGALTIVGVYLTAVMLTRQRVSALVGALALAVSFTFWSQALIAEVYTMGAAIGIGIILCLIYWDTKRKPIALAIAGLLGGLSMGVHLGVVLSAPAILLFLLSYGRKRVAWRAAIGGAISGVIITVGLFSWLQWRNPVAGYFRSVIAPSRSAWGLGKTQIDRLFERLWFGWTAQQFRSYMFTDTASVMREQSADYLANLPREFTSIVLFFALLGLLFLLLKRPRIALLATVALLTHWAYTFNYQIWDIYVFYIPGYIWLALLAAVGMGGLISLLPRYQLGADGVLALAVLLLGVWPIFRPNITPILAHEMPFTHDDYPTEWYGDTLHPLALSIVTALPQDAILFTDWDMIYPLYFVAQVEGERPDLMFIETQPDDGTPEIAHSIAEFVANNLDFRPIFFSERVDELERNGYQFSPTRLGGLRAVQIKKSASGN